MRIIVGLLFAAASFSSCGGGMAVRREAEKTAVDRRYDSVFWDTWGDGFAEVSVYGFETPRDGELRDGESILIFSSEKLGKIPVIKLNWLRNFQTGISDFSEMNTSFLSLVNGRMAKTSFSRQNWDGHLFAQAVFDPSGIRVMDGDAALQTLENQENWMSEDGLIFWARGMAGPFLKPGETVTLPFLTGLRSAKDARQPMAWSRVQLTRGAEAEKVETSAGEFVVELYSADLPSGKGFRFMIEKDAPYRMVRWQTTAGEVGELYASERVKYWEMNLPGGEEALRQLGLEPRTPRLIPDEPQNE